MPRVNGVYQLPPGSYGAPNTTIQSNKYNTLIDDLASEANGKRPIGAGGTGASSAVEANDALNTISATMASAATLNLANATGVVVNVTGTTTITALGTVSSGAERVLVFAAALTLTHNATSLILPGGANIVTAAGDVATFRSKGSGNWVCVGYQAQIRPEVSLVNLKGADMASAATVNLATATGDFVNITGTTTMTALGTVPAGAERTLVFAGALTLTHNATSLILPGSANIVTAAGDVATFRSLGSGNWDCINYVRASGMPISVAAQAQAQAGTDNGSVMTPLRTMDAINARKLVIGPVATSGSSAFDLTNIPPWARRLTLLLAGLNASSGTAILVQVGTSSGVTTTGYSAARATINGANSSSGSTATAFEIANTSDGVIGTVTLCLDASSNTWMQAGMAGRGTSIFGSAGSLTLAGVLDRLRVSRAGTGNFSSGSITLIIE